MPVPKLSIQDSPPEPAEVFLAVRDYFSGHPLEQDLCADELAARLFVLSYLNSPPIVADVQAAQEPLLGVEVRA